MPLPTLAKSKPEFDWYRSDYGSKLRDGAAILAMAAESNPTPPIVPELINRGYELVTIHTLAAANGVDLAAGETYYGFHGGTTNE